MKTRMLSELDHIIKSVMSMPIDEVVDDCRALIAALFLSAPDECIRVKHRYPQDPLVDLVLNTVRDFRTDKALLKTFIDGGFFNEQLEELLDIAKKDRIGGARLMPIFCMALNASEFLKLPVDLEAKIISHIEWQRQADGFALVEFSQGKGVIVPADDTDITGYEVDEE